MQLYDIIQRTLQIIKQLMWVQNNYNLNVVIFLAVIVLGALRAQACVFVCVFDTVIYLIICYKYN